MPYNIEGVNFYTTKETAELLRVTQTTIRAWIKSGRLHGKRIGRPTLISEKDIRRFLGPSLIDGPVL